MASQKTPSDRILAIHVIDSHTGGEPTRVVIAGGPELGCSNDLSERRERFLKEFDAVRRAIILEPRGFDVLVGALLCSPVDEKNVSGVIFFNNVGYLGMCGHGMIGVVVTLGHLGRINAGRYVLETPVGCVPVEFDGANTVSLENVTSYRIAANVTVHVDGLGDVTGDVAWGGNGFFLVHNCLTLLSRVGLSLEMAHVKQLTDISQRIMDALRKNGLAIWHGMTVDHVELFGPPGNNCNHGRNFVLCPGGAYDRSPCGTGTSAKLACLAADGRLLPGEIWRQESILGSVFEASYQLDSPSLMSDATAVVTADAKPIVSHNNGVGDVLIRPRISGQAFITAETVLCLDPADPFAYGIGQ